MNHFLYLIFHWLFLILKYVFSFKEIYIGLSMFCSFYFYHNCILLKLVLLMIFIYELTSLFNISSIDIIYFSFVRILFLFSIGVHHSYCRLNSIMINYNLLLIFYEMLMGHTWLIFLCLDQIGTFWLLTLFIHLKVKNRYAMFLLLCCICCIRFLIVGYCSFYTWFSFLY